MATVPLRLVGWEYDTDRNRVIASFVDAPTPSDPDPVSHTPTLNFYVEFIPSHVEQDGVPQGGA